MKNEIDYEQEVKNLYPDASMCIFQINDWGYRYIVGKTSKPFTECEEDEDFLSSTDNTFCTPEDAWAAAYYHQLNITP